MAYFTNLKCFLFPSFDISKKEQHKLDEFLRLLEESGVAEVINEELKRDTSLGGRIPFDPYKLFATILYSFSKHSGSLRKIEESINYDLRFIYLMEQKRPSYVTISKFLNNVVVKHHQNIFLLITSAIIERYKIDTSDVFLDGTKFEANVNKYKFVWKPDTFHKRLNENIRTLLTKYFTLSPSKTNFVSKEIAEYVNELNEIAINHRIIISDFQTGRGHRIPEIVKDYNLLTKFLLKTLEYEEKERICGSDRKSFYKTDHDATAMCLKRDYYSGLGTNMHPAYNAQIMVSKGIILQYYVGQERSDYVTLPKIIDLFYENYGHYPKRLCADAGYGSYLNYSYIEEHGIENYVKYSTWEKEKNGTLLVKYRFNENNELVCLNNKIAKEYSSYKNTHPKSKNTTTFVIEKCGRCKYRELCTNSKNMDGKIFRINKEFYRYQQEAMRNLLSPKGIELRVNRSSQVEGAFGVIKQDMNYDRVRRRGLENVSTEFMLVCLGYNINKFFKLVDGTAKLDYWKCPENISPEIKQDFDIEKALSKIKKNSKRG